MEAVAKTALEAFKCKYSCIQRGLLPEDILLRYFKKYLEQEENLQQNIVLEPLSNDNESERHDKEKGSYDKSIKYDNNLDKKKESYEEDITFVNDSLNDDNIETKQNKIKKQQKEMAGISPLSISKKFLTRRKRMGDECSISLVQSFHF